MTWLRDDIVSAEAVAPEGRWYDLDVYRQQIGEWLPLVSDIADLYEARLIDAMHDERDRHQLYLHLEVSAEVADLVRQKSLTLRMPLDLGRA